MAVSSKNFPLLDTRVSSIAYLVTANAALDVCGERLLLSGRSTTFRGERSDAILRYYFIAIAATEGCSRNENYWFSDKSRGAFR